MFFSYWFNCNHVSSPLLKRKIFVRNNMKNKENDTTMSITIWLSFQNIINYLLQKFYYIMLKYCLRTNVDEHTNHLTLSISYIWWWTHHVRQKNILVKQWKEGLENPFKTKMVLFCWISYTLNWQMIDLKTHLYEKEWPKKSTTREIQSF